MAIIYSMIFLNVCMYACMCLLRPIKKNFEVTEGTKKGNMFGVLPSLYMTDLGIYLDKMTIL